MRNVQDCSTGDGGLKYFLYKEGQVPISDASIVQALNQTNYWLDLIIGFSNHDSKWKQYQIGTKVMPKFSECTAPNGLHIGKHKQSNIIKQIIHLKFSALQWLSLNANHIQNIQQLAYLQAPSLRKLWLDQNHIRNLQPFRKSIKVSSINTFQINNNLIVDLKFMSEWDGKNLKYLSLDYVMDPTMCEGVSALVKTNFEINQLLILSKNRISVKKVFDKMADRFPNIFISRV